jgi:hypothetical protein
VSGRIWTESVSVSLASAFCVTTMLSAASETDDGDEILLVVANADFRLLGSRLPSFAPAE